MRRSRRALLQYLTLTLAGLTVGSIAACRGADEQPRPSIPDDDEDEDDFPDPAAQAAPTSIVARAPSTAGIIGTPVPSSEPGATPQPPEADSQHPAPSTQYPVLTVAVPPTPTSAPPTPAPTPTPRPRPLRALLTVPYYSQHVGRINYCLPTSIAMIADRYDRLPADVSGTSDRAPRFVADVAYGFAKRRIAALNEQQFTELWEEIGTDPLGGLIWDVFAPNGRDLAAGMSPALAYLVLSYAFELTPVLGTVDECLVALSDNVPSILFGSYGALRRADGMPPNVGGYTGDHALVLVGVDYDRILVNDPLPSDKTRYSGERSRATASLRAVRFDLASVRRMTRGDGGKPRGDCFMVPPGTA